MTYWIKRRFRLIRPEEIERVYEWNTRSQTWNRIPPSSVSRKRTVRITEIYQRRDTLLDKFREQRERPEDVKAQLTEEEKVTEEPVLVNVEWERYKAYIVWYSSGDKGKNYDTKREIAVYWWKNAREEINESQINDWLNTACRSIFGTSIDTVKGWIDAINANNLGKGYAYWVTTASVGQFETSKPYDVDQVLWQYLVKDHVERSGTIYKGWSNF